MKFTAALSVAGVAMRAVMLKYFGWNRFRRAGIRNPTGIYGRRAMRGDSAYGLSRRPAKRGASVAFTTRFAWPLPQACIFVLDKRELVALRRQFGASKNEQRDGMRYSPMAFTEQGVAMLSSVLM